LALITFADAVVAGALVGGGNSVLGLSEACVRLALMVVPVVMVVGLCCAKNNDPQNDDDTISQQSDGAAVEPSCACCVQIDCSNALPHVSLAFAMALGIVSLLSFEWFTWGYATWRHGRTITGLWGSYGGDPSDYDQLYFKAGIDIAAALWVASLAFYLATVLSFLGCKPFQQQKTAATCCAAGSLCGVVAVALMTSACFRNGGVLEWGAVVGILSAFMGLLAGMRLCCIAFSTSVKPQPQPLLSGVTGDGLMINGNSNGSSSGQLQLDVGHGDYTQVV
jgi:hypothetical protein